MLLAVQLEAVHQASQDRIREGEALEALRSDLAVMLDRLKADIRAQEGTVAAHRELFRLRRDRDPSDCRLPGHPGVPGLEAS